MEREIEIINRIIDEGVWHGADCGGSYDQNERRLLEAIQSWIELKGLTEKYEIREVKTSSSGRTFQIVER